MQHPLVRPSLAPYGFAHHHHSDRLGYTSDINPYWVNAERLMAKFWDRRHRIDAPDPLPIETIIHRILPAQAQANRLSEGEFTFRGLPYLSYDIALLSSIMYWFGTNVGSCFLERPTIFPPKGRLGRPEYEFLAKYEREMQRRDMVAFWGHQCTHRCSQDNVMLSPFVSPHAYDSRTITSRDRAVTEGLMRWLGRPEGRVFIADWLAHLERARDTARARQARQQRQKEVA